MDTLKFAKDLESTGLSREQAEASSEAVARVFATSATDLANKQDMEVLKAQIRNDMKDVIGGLTAALAKSHNELESKANGAEIALMYRIDDAKAWMMKWVLVVGVIEVTLIVVSIYAMSNHITSVVEMVHTLTH